MENLIKKEFKQLANHQSDICISIYIPTHQKGIEVNQKIDAISFKNHILNIEKKLKDEGYRSDPIKDLLAPAWTLVEDQTFWNKQYKGLAVFISNGIFKCYKMHVPVEDFLFVGKEFHLSPLIPIIMDRSHYFVLALSMNQVKLYSASQFGMTEIKLKNFSPKNIDEETQYDDFTKQIETHTGNTLGKAGKELKKESVERFVDNVDEAVLEVIGSTQEPLVIASVDYLFGLYKKHSTYQNVMEQCIPGNPEHTNEEQLHEQSWSIVHSYFEQNRLLAEQEYENNLKSEITTSDINEIVESSMFSRIDKLFLVNGTHLWGQYIPEEHKVNVHNEYMNGDEDLLNVAAINTIKNGGEVYVVDEFRMPVNSGYMAAVLRYPGRIAQA